jgi:hypothetical protein
VFAQARIDSLLRLSKLTLSKQAAIGPVEGLYLIYQAIMVEPNLGLESVRWGA